MFFDFLKWSSQTAKDLYIDNQVTGLLNKIVIYHAHMQLSWMNRLVYWMNLNIQVYALWNEQTYELF